MKVPELFKTTFLLLSKLEELDVSHSLSARMKEHYEITLLRITNTTNGNHAEFFVDGDVMTIQHWDDDGVTTWLHQFQHDVNLDYLAIQLYDHLMTPTPLEN